MERTSYLKFVLNVNGMLELPVVAQVLLTPSRHTIFCFIMGPPL